MIFNPYISAKYLSTLICHFHSKYVNFIYTKYIINPNAIILVKYFKTKLSY